MAPFLLLIPLLPALAAAVALVTRHREPLGARLSGWATAAAAASALALTVGVLWSGPTSLVWDTADGDVLVGLAADEVGALLALLTTSVGAVVIGFARRQFDGDTSRRSFFAKAALLTSATTVMALGATATAMAVGWVLAGVVMGSLVADGRRWHASTAAARHLRRTLAIGDTALVVAVGVMLAMAGDPDLRAVDVTAAALADEHLGLFGADLAVLDLVAVLLVVAGIARSALVPAHRWLVGTVAAPTPVSALLHAGVVNGAGVLLVRYAPVAGASEAAMWTAFLAGFATAVVATAVMLVRTDVKGSLAWSTAGQMGFMTVQVAVGAFAAALFHLLGHAMYKAALFLGAGGSITAHQRQRHLPHPGRPIPRAVRLVASVAIGTAAVAGALVLVDPHLSTSATVLVVVFGSLSASRLLSGWLGALTPSVGGVALGIVGAVAWTFAYVAGVALVEGAVADAVPYEVSGAVDTAWLVSALALVAVGATAVRFAPGARGDDLRRRCYVALHAIGARRPRRAWTPARGPRVTRSPAAAVVARTAHRRSPVAATEAVSPVASVVPTEEPHRVR